MSNELRIEAMKVEDIDMVNAVNYEVYLDNPDDYEWIKDGISDPYAYFYIAFWDDELVGYCGTYHNTTMKAHNFHYFKIGSVAIKKDYRRKGIAKALMIKALDTAKKLGLDKIKLEVDTKNGAVKLYESLGFKIEETEKDFYDYGGDAYIMWRTN